jgi:two-component system cell cycle response regulator
MIAPKILGIDDSKMIHTIIGKAFRNYDVQLFFASNGVEGLAVATRENPDLILLDVTMPVMDGVETLTKLKADPVLKEIPVIMLTAEAGKENVVKIARIGVRDYIIKPFSEQSLIERAGRVVDLHPKGSNGAKTKSIDDPATILVVDDKPAIIDQVRQAVGSMPWKIVGSAQCGEAIDLSSRENPDAILVSLSLPERAAFGFFQMIRANPRTKATPVFGLSVKTASDEQAQAQSVGFNGIITKPLDQNELVFRLTRAMNLDTSRRFFSSENNIQTVRLPAEVTEIVASEVNHYLGPKTKEMVESGSNRLILDASEITKLDMAVTKLILGVINVCRELSIKFRLVGNAEFQRQAKAFEETKDLEVFPSKEAAIAGF